MTIKFSIITFVLISLCSCLEQAPIKTGFEGKPLPSFTFELPNSFAMINTDTLKVEKSFAIFYFSPDCPHCRAEIRDIIKHHEEVKKNKFLLITNYSKEEVQNVINEFKLNEYKNIVTAIDNKSYFLKYYFIPNVPYLAIYDKKKKFRQALVGKTDFQTIERSLEAN